MDYQLLIFMTNKLLKAVEVVSKDQYELINIDGNEMLEYHGEKGIRKFCDSLKEYYSIDEFSDLEMEISLIYNEVSNQVILELVKQLERTERVNTVGLEKLIPIILTNRKLIKRNTDVYAEFMETYSKISVNEQMEILTVKSTPVESAIKLTEQDFGFLVHFTASYCMEDELVKKQEASSAEALKTVKAELEKAKEQLKRSSQTVEELLEEKLINEKISNNYSRQVAEIICEFLSRGIRFNLPGTSFKNDDYIYKFFWKADNGILVKTGDVIAEIKRYMKNDRRRRDIDFVLPLYASQMGILFYLFEDGSEVLNDILVAFIGNHASLDVSLAHYCNKFSDKLIVDDRYCMQIDEIIDRRKKMKEVKDADPYSNMYNKARILGKRKK